MIVDTNLFAHMVPDQFLIVGFVSMPVTKRGAMKEKIIVNMANEEMVAEYVIHAHMEDWKKHAVNVLDVSIVRGKVDAKFVIYLGTYSTQFVTLYYDHWIDTIK